MEDQELREKLAELERGIKAVHISAEKTRTYLLWTLVITVAVVVLPAIGLVFAVPSFLSIYSTIGGM